MAARAIPPGVCMTRSIGCSSGVSLITLSNSSLSSMSMYLARGSPNRLRVSCLWIRVITLVPRFLPRLCSAFDLAFCSMPCWSRG